MPKMSLIACVGTPALPNHSFAVFRMFSSSFLVAGLLVPFSTNSIATWTCCCGWYDVERTLKVPPGTTLSGLIALAEKRGVPLREAIDNSPHLRHTLMWNGDRCPVDEHGERAVKDGDEIYLLAPIAGG